MQINTKKIKQIAGFSLIELSLALVVISSLAVVAITKYTADKQNERALKAYEDLKDIKTAIEAYVAANNRYPCPADPTLAENDASFGIGQRDGASGACIEPPLHALFNDKDGLAKVNHIGEPYKSIQAVPTDGVMSSDDIIMGAIPCKDIGLSPDCVFDPYGNRYSYAVIPEMAQINACSKYVIDSGGTLAELQRAKIFKKFNPENSTADNYSNSDNLYTADPDLEGYADYVLLYFGADGIGAYPHNGNAGTASGRIEPLSTDGGTTFLGDNAYQEINHNLHWAAAGLSYNMDEYFFAPDTPIASQYTFGDIVVFGQSSTLANRYCVACSEVCSLGAESNKVVAVSNFGTCGDASLTTACGATSECTVDTDCDPGGCMDMVPGSCCAAGTCIDYRGGATGTPCDSANDCASSVCRGANGSKAGDGGTAPFTCD